MTLLEKIRTAKTRKELNLLVMEVILSKDYKENAAAAFKKKNEELRDETGEVQA